MRPTCRAVLVFASFSALPVGLASAGDPPTPVPEAVPSAERVRVLDAVSILGGLLGAPAPAPAAASGSPLPRLPDAPVLGVLFRGGGGGGGAGPVPPPQGDRPRGPGRGDARPHDPRRAELEALIRKAIEDAYAYRRAVGAPKARGPGPGRGPAAPVAPMPPKAPPPPKPPHAPLAPPSRPGGDAHAPGEASGFTGIVLVVGPDGTSLRFRLVPEGGPAGPVARPDARPPMPPGRAADEALRPRARAGRGFFPGLPAGPGRAGGPPPPPPGVHGQASPLEALRDEVRALRREVHALRARLAKVDDDACDACADRAAPRGRADRDDACDCDECHDRLERAPGRRDRRDEPRPRHRQRPGPWDGPGDDRR